MLQCNNLSVAERLRAFSTQVEAGSRVHIVGPNGAGKSSLLARMAGLLQGAGGVSLAGQSLDTLSGPQLARRRGYLCQQSAPISMMPVFQYLSLHQPAMAEAALVASTVAHLTRELHLEDKLHRPVTRLSGGEWQRVRLAATLLQVWPTLNPQSQLLLLDEPMNSLDVAQQQALDGLIDHYCASGRIAIMSDHDLNHTLHHAGIVWLMKAGQVLVAGDCINIMQPEALSGIFGVNFQMHNLENQRWLSAAPGIIAH